MRRNVGSEPGNVIEGAVTAATVGAALALLALAYVADRRRRPRK
jgi:hypothetical protein